MQQKMKSTVIQLKNGQQASFSKVISYTKFGYNALFKSNPTQGFQSFVQPKYFDIYAFSKSLLQINNLKGHLEQIVKLYSKMNNSKILCPIIEKIDTHDMFYLVSQVQKYSLKQLIAKRQGLTEYEVTYFIMEIFQILNYCKSRQIYFEKLELNNFYLNGDMKLSVPFNIFLNKATNKPLMKRLPFRNQAKNRNNCPELFWNSSAQKQSQREKSQNKSQIHNQISQQAKNHSYANVNLVASWNMGILIYELFQNCKPFQTNCSVPIFGHNTSSRTTKDEIYHNETQTKSFYQLKFYQTQSVQAKQFITKLLQVDLKKRLNFPLILIEPIVRKFEQIPHILPSTILTCPPSEQFKQSYRHSFPKNKLLEPNTGSDPNNNMDQNSNIYNRSLKKRNQIIKTQIISRSTSSNHIETLNKSKQPSNQKITKNQRRQSFGNSIPYVDPQLFTPIFQTQKYIKAEQRSLTENKIYIEQFVDISHVYGYGYQMNTGTLCFVFNDETEFYFPNANRKHLIYVNDKKRLTTYSYDKLPEEEDLKKKFFILQAYSKSIKKFKTPAQQGNTSGNEKMITILRYGKTKHASIFYLSNDSVQVFFNDKICFLMTKNNLYILSKNNDKYEKYDYRNETNEMKTRRDYVVAMVKKVFGWKKDKILEESDKQDEIVQKSQKNQTGYQKNSILGQVYQNGLENKQSRLQSLKKIKQKQERNYHLKKRSIVPHVQQQID